MLNLPHIPPKRTQDWSEEDWDVEIKDGDKMRKKQRKEKLEKASGYPSPEREVPILVMDQVPVPVPREIKSKSQERKEQEERIENRRIVEGINEDEDLDYYSDLDSMYQNYV